MEFYFTLDSRHDKELFSNNIDKEAKDQKREREREREHAYMKKGLVVANIFMVNLEEGKII